MGFQTRCCGSTPLLLHRRWWRRRFEPFFGGNAPQRESRRGSLGSGFIIAKDGYSVTNSHVVENASDMKVSLSDKEAFAAKVVGCDPKTDVALIKVEADRDLPVAPLGDSNTLQVGEWVITIGNPVRPGTHGHGRNRQR
ncbi:MAG: trypsin-like peptidase domain-containing protein [Candidatus Entotheonellia bacterium]